MAIKDEPRELALPKNAVKPSRPQPKPGSGEKERQDALKQLRDYRRAAAWPVHRWPLEKCAALERTRIHLPRTYRARGGLEVRAVHSGADLNVLVHRFYLEEVRGGEKGRRDGDKERDVISRLDGVQLCERGPNYVTADDVVPRRHEYLGPDPRVVGYFFDGAGEVHVRFWDAFLRDQWMDTQTWQFDVRMDEHGKWAERED
ncbi:hypothetical protein SCP_1104330 [Sparassis crispa]|uniref:Uncharacterized protein n=1 Tax=Sparassis crispa TaxID=139825 RepID=A0A401H000_9APHY|nr:hypothetical protein SCP_1104330 [Sparassis crispa]GBE87756.1 hypothetical protein SCP_1104330 [Sparassis crispa]